MCQQYSFTLSTLVSSLCSLLTPCDLDFRQSCEIWMLRAAGTCAAQVAHLQRVFILFNISIATLSPVCHPCWAGPVSLPA